MRSSPCELEVPGKHYGCSIELQGACSIELQGVCSIELQVGCSLPAPVSTTVELPLLMLLVLQAALGLLRVCTRLLPYKYDVAEPLLKSMQLVLRLNSNVAWELAQQIAAEVTCSYCWCLTGSPRAACIVALHLSNASTCAPAQEVPASG